MKTTKKYLAIFLALAMLFSLIPGLALATGGGNQYGYDETPASSVKVYVTFSNDGLPLNGNDTGATPLAHLEVDVPYFDLANYGLANYYRYGTAGGQGSYIDTNLIKRPTAMHLFIYMTERYYMGISEELCGKGSSGVTSYSASTENSYFDGTPAYTSSLPAYTVGGNAMSTLMNYIWGHDLNLLYYRNHVYPLMTSELGASSDYILLSDYDTFDFAMFTNQDLMLSVAFISFDEDSYSANEGDSLAFNTLWTEPSSFGGGPSLPEPMTEPVDVAVYDANWTRIATAAGYDGAYSHTFDKAGTYYLLASDLSGGTEAAIFSPGTAKVVVTGKPAPEPIPDATVPDDFENDLWLQYGFKQLTVGGTSTIYPRRVPQAVSNLITNDVQRPNFNFEIIQGDSIGIELVKSGSRNDSAKVTALKPGVTIVKVTYDEFYHTNVAAPFGAVSDVNVAYAAFYVTDGTDSGITVDFNDRLTSYDTVYFVDGNYVNYDIAPIVTGADNVEVTCNGKPVAASGDVYTLPLENRSNVIGIHATKSTGEETYYYRVIDARKIEINITNTTNPGAPLSAGDKAKISFRGITIPVYKLATIYNPTLGSSSYVEYTNGTLGTFQGKSAQYNLATQNSFDVTFTDAGDFLFSGGRIHEAWYGSVLGSDKGTEGQGEPNLSAPTLSAYFSIMPDFTVSVAPPQIHSVEGVSIDQENQSIIINTTLALSATVTPANATNKTVTWSSADDSIASVTPGGTVTANSIGATTITVTTEDGGYTASLEIEVTSEPPATQAQRKALGDLIASVKTLKEAEYSTETWSALQTELTPAEAVYNDPEALVAAVNAAQAALTSVKNKLVKTGMVLDITVSPETINAGTTVTVTLNDIVIPTPEGAVRKEFYTTFSTDLPGLAVIKSADGRSNSELLKTLTFDIPEDTAPGEYSLYGGYIHSVSGPNPQPPFNAMYDVKYYEGLMPNISITVTPPPVIPDGAIVIPESYFENLKKYNGTVYDTFYYTEGEIFYYKGAEVTFINENTISADSVQYALKNKKISIPAVVTDGDKVTISFTGLATPINQISGLWSSLSGNGSERIISYASGIPAEAAMTSALWQGNPATLAFSGFAPGEYTLTGGSIYEKANRYSPGANLGSGVVTEGFFGRLPDISFVVSEAPVTLESVEMQTPPEKVAYIEGETFDATGLVIVAVYSDGSEVEITDFTVSKTDALTAADTQIFINVIFEGTAFSFPVDITVEPAVVEVPEEITVKFWVYGPDYSFLMMDSEITVTEGTAAEYGWMNTAPGTMIGGEDHGVYDDEITALDAIIAAHEEYYGSDEFNPSNFTSKLGSSATYLSKMFGTSGEITFSVNDRAPIGPMSDGYGVNECVLQDGDNVYFFFYEDEWEMGPLFAHYAVFDQATAEIETGSDLTLNIKEFLFLQHMWGSPGTPTVEPTLYNAPGLGVFIVDDNGDFVEMIGETDANGNVTVSFDAPGTYILSAVGEAADDFMGSMPVITPRAIITVTGDPIIPTDPTAYKVTLETAATAVNAGETFTVDVILTGSEQFGGFDITATVSDNVEFLGAEKLISNGASGVNFDGNVLLFALAGGSFTVAADSLKVATLTFKANKDISETKLAEIVLTAANVSPFAGTGGGTLQPAGVGEPVEVSMYNLTVTFKAGEGVNMTEATAYVKYGESTLYTSNDYATAFTVPVPTAESGYTLDAPYWDYTAGTTFTESAEYTATAMKNTYVLTVPEEAAVLSGAEEIDDILYIENGTDVTFKLGSTDAGYIYSVSYKVGNADAVNLTESEGIYTISGGAIVDDIEIIVSRTVAGTVTFLSFDEFRGAPEGFKVMMLALPEGRVDGATYLFDETAMFWSDKYPPDETVKGAFVFFVDEEMTEEEARAMITLTTEGDGNIEITYNYNVNGGAFDLIDAQIPMALYSQNSTLYLEDDTFTQLTVLMRLEADVNGDGTVNLMDVQLVLNKLVGK